MLGFAVAVLFTRRIDLLALGGFLSFASFIHQGSTILVKMKPLGGYANWVTGLRLVLILIGCFLFTYVPTAAILVVMLVAVLLDLVDGFMARKYGHVSFFGQYFDMEVDAFFVLVMCFYYYLFDGIAWWILIPGLLRYVFKIFTTLHPKEGFIETKKRYGSIIAGTFFAILLISIVFKIPYLLLFGSMAIVLSFSVSIFEYLKY
jgi:phosphatidylglycerophosphate synthase